MTTLTGAEAMVEMLKVEIVFGLCGDTSLPLYDALASRDRPGGVIEEGYVTSLSGKRVPVSADTLCLHGDQPGAVAFAKAIRSVFSERGIEIAAP